jgi:hypothetical protein
MIVSHCWASSTRADAAGIGIPESDISVRYRTGSGIGILFLYRYQTGQMPENPACRLSQKLDEVRKVYTADGGEGYTLHVLILLLIMVNSLCDVEKSYVNAGMPICRKIVSLASTFLPVVS